jgi:L-lactate dehydrogenase complex protein LldG
VALLDGPARYPVAAELGTDELTHIVVDRLEDYEAGVTVVVEADMTHRHLNSQTRGLLPS